MTREDRVRRYWQAFWTDGAREAATSFYAPVFRLNGRETAAELWADGALAFRSHFTGFEVELDLLAGCASQMVVTRTRYRARHTRDFDGIPARAGAVDVSGIDVFVFEGDRVADHWHEADHLEMYRQMGVELPG